MMEFFGLEIVTNGLMDIILGIIATLASLVLFLQPMPTFWRVCRKKDVGGLLPYQYLVSALNSVLWFAYAAPEIGTTIQFRDVCTCCSSIVGMTIGLIYTYIFWRCCDRDHFQLFGLGMCATYISPFIIPRSWLRALVMEEKTNILGPMVIVLGTMLYATPIFNVIYAVRRKRIEYMPIQVLVTSCLNGFAWMMYGCLPPNFDLCLVITHGFGTVFSIAQLGVAYEIQSFMTVSGTDIGKQTTKCNVIDDEKNKFMGSVYTPLLNDKRNEEDYFDAITASRVHPCDHLEVKGQVVDEAAADVTTVKKQLGKHGGESKLMNGTTCSDVCTTSEVHPSRYLKLKGKVVDEKEGAVTTTVKEQHGKYCQEDDIVIEKRPMNLSFPSSASFFGGAMERELEAKFNEFGLSAVMSYALAAYFGGFQAALYVENTMSKMICDLRSENSELQQDNDKFNLSNDLLRESADTSQVKLKEFLEAVGKKGDEVHVKSKEFLEAVEKKGNEVQVKLKEFLEAVGMKGGLDSDITSD